MKFTIYFLIVGTLVLQACRNHKHITDRNNYFGDYSIYDEETGTETVMKVEGENRILTTNSIPDHHVGVFPNPGNPNTIKPMERSYTIPVNPKFIGTPKWVKEPGVALNGVKFDPGTGEVVQCESGENFRIEAIQQIYDLGLDHNHAHVQPSGEYHYHGIPVGVVKTNDKGGDLVHVGFAKDGFGIYYSKSEKYAASYQLISDPRDGTDCTYSNPKVKKPILLQGSEADGTYLPDWEYVDGLGDLDECNGIEIDGKYMYLVTEKFPYIGRCLMGEFVEKRRKGPPKGDRRGGPPPGAQGPRG